MLRSVILLAALLSAPNAFSHPVAYKGATAVMTWNQPFMSDTWITYSFESNMAGAARFMRMTMPEGQMNYAGAQFDYLFFRDNGFDHQANLYAYGGGGNVQYNGSNGGAYLVGIEANAETRKYYGLLKVERLGTHIAPNFNHFEGRLGIAPYEAEYNEMATWFMVQLQKHPALIKQLVVTPLARIYYKSFLLETGVSFDGDWMTNFMFHF